MLAWVGLSWALRRIQIEAMYVAIHLVFFHVLAQMLPRHGKLRKRVRMAYLKSRPEVSLDRWAPAFIILLCHLPCCGEARRCRG